MMLYIFHRIVFIVGFLPRTNTVKVGGGRPYVLLCALFQAQAGKSNKKCLHRTEVPHFSTSHKILGQMDVRLKWNKGLILLSYSFLS